MKPLFENWRQYLNEELLTEFDKGDEETLMAEQDRFTISYEIELESKEPLAHEDIRELTLQLENVPAYYHGARTAENFFQHYFKEPYVDEDDIIDFYKRENLIPLPQQSQLETKEFKDFAGELATLTPSQMQNIPRYLKVEDITDKEFLKKFIMFYKKLAYEFEEQLMYELHEDPIAFARKYLSEVIPESELGKYTGQEAIPVLREFFPRFMKKWEGQLKFETDESLDNGVEFSMDNPKFITGLDKAFEFLKDFFFDYNRQENFYFAANTGVHTNIGYLDDDKKTHKDYNLMKALLFLNHDFATKDFPSRRGNRFAGDLKSEIAQKLETEFKKDRSKFRDLALELYKTNKLDELGKELSQFIEHGAPENPKYIGFNIRYIDNLGYVEFRYPGGEAISLEALKRATLKYAYIIKQAVDPTFKKDDYYGKLVKLITSLKSHVDRPTEVKKIKEFMKKNEVYLMPTNVRPVAINSYMQHVLGHSLPYSMYATEAGIFKGIRKGKTLKDTTAVFKVVEGVWDHLDNPSVQMTDRANYKIGERTIPLPELERMITNDSLNFVNSNSIEKRIRDIFKIVSAGYKVKSKPPPKKKKPLDTPPWIGENKIKVLLERG